MASLGRIEKNKRRMRMHIKYRSAIRELLVIRNDKTKSMDERFNAQLELSRIPRNAHLVRVRRRCNLTGRSRGVYRYFGLSRSPLRERVSYGLVPGAIKYSW